MIPEYKDAETMKRMPEESAVKLLTIDNYKFDFGKHAGKTIPEIYAVDPGYIIWAKSNMEKEPARSLLKDFEV